MDLTGEHFDRFDGYEAYFSFDIPRELPRDVTLWVWGSYVDLDIGGTEERCYVKGYAPVCFREVAGFRINVALYRATGDMIRDGEGKIVALSRSWGVSGGDGTIMYDFQGVSVWPLGECDFTVWGRGEVTIGLHEAEIVPGASPADRALPPELEGKFGRSIQPD